MLMQNLQKIEPGWRPGIASIRERAEPGFGFPLSVEQANAAVAYSHDVEVYGEGEPSEYFYMVVSGAVRIYKVLVDGRRQVCAFHLRGDIFGVEADESHAFSAETITDCKIVLIKRSAVIARAEWDKEVARQLQTIVGCELKRVQAHVLLLIKTAKERVAEFLLEMARRVPPNQEVELPMSRQDIADYLGLTIETVSRTLTGLEKRDAIYLPNSRRVVLRDRGVLEMCGG
jgi:CRP/FNR family nitrogen fixation transcriptional regulator